MVTTMQTELLQTVYESIVVIELAKNSAIDFCAM